jgi:transcriptional regulator with XRE-family HTH domain
MLARRNLTQNELGRRAGVSSGHLSQIMNGGRFPSPAIRQRLMEILGPVDFDDIFEIEEVPDVTEDGAH